jgi:Peptidase family M28
LGKGQARIRIAANCALLLFVFLLAAEQAPLAPPIQAVLDHVSADSLRGHLSFIASDLLEGRATPSRGLDLAAAYISAQFRRAGIEPAGDDGYYQTAEMMEVAPPKAGFEMTIADERRTMSVRSEEVTPRFHTPLEISQAGIYKLNGRDERAMRELKPEDVAGKVVVTELPDFSGAIAGDAMRKFGDLLRAIRRAKPGLTLMLTVDGIADLNTRLVTREERQPAEPLRLIVRNPEVLQWYTSLRPGLTRAVLSLRLPEPVETRVKLRNVIGLLRGSDPVLKETYVLLTAHYDHLGVRPEGAGGGIFNGANDDGSGTVSVIELASALATLNPRPKRSIVFMTFFGEEEGILGSRYYADHPVFPIDETVADVNLEQVGRTDALDGLKLKQATFTGGDYSDLPRVFQVAGKRTGVRVLKDKPDGESFFARSDNLALAEKGVPAHTVAVAFEFPDYHQVGDKWQKIDYENMAKIDRMLALGVILLADNPRASRWDESLPQTGKYVEAWREHHR